LKSKRNSGKTDRHNSQNLVLGVQTKSRGVGGRREYPETKKSSEGKAGKG